jgi:predicted O-methyltransferase YrrM
MLQLWLGRPNLSTCVEALLSLLPGLNRQDIEEIELEFSSQQELFREMNALMLHKRSRRMDLPDWGEFIYALVRMCKPKVMMETGVFDGVSSVIILQAMAKNKAGILVSIDLPAHDTTKDPDREAKEGKLPIGCRPGWLIPNHLRSHHRLELGDSKELLPKLFEEYPKIDVFFHDSLHTFEHMAFEYNIAWKHLADRGILISDDIFWNPAFHLFCKRQRKEYIIVPTELGVVRK